MKKTKKSKVKNAIDHNLSHIADNIRDTARNELSVVAADYLACVIDPKRAKPARIPTLIGGDPGLTSLIKLKIRGTAVVGSGGMGFINIADGDKNGFYSNRIAGTYSTNTYAGTTVTGDTAVGGVSPLSFVESPYIADANNSLAYRLVGLAVETYPTSSALTQGGSLCLFESPGHLNKYVQGLTYASIASFNRARELRGAQLGNVKDKISLNIHPVSTYSSANHSGPFDFKEEKTVNTTTNTQGGCSGCIAFRGTSGQSYEFSLTAVYEFRGRGIPNPRIGLTDSRGMNLVLNTFRAKQQSGWVGDPNHIHHGYFASLLKSIVKVEPIKLIKRAKDFYDNHSDDIRSVATIAGF